MFSLFVDMEMLPVSDVYQKNIVLLLILKRKKAQEKL